MDKAGKAYWDQRWKDGPLPKAVNPRQRGLNNYVHRKFHEYFTSIFSSFDTKGKKLLEVGCARSAWLPYFANEFGFEVWGVDYSESGCEQARRILQMSADLRTLISRDAGTVKGELRLGVGRTFAREVVPPLVLALRRQYRGALIAGVLSFLPVLLWRAYVASIFWADYGTESVFHAPDNTGTPFGGMWTTLTAVQRGEYLSGLWDAARAAVSLAVLTTAAVGLAVRCPSCVCTTVNLVTAEHVDVQRRPRRHGERLEDVGDVLEGEIAQRLEVGDRPQAGSARLEAGQPPGAAFGHPGTVVGVRRQEELSGGTPGDVLLNEQAQLREVGDRFRNRELRLGTEAPPPEGIHRVVHVHAIVLVHVHEPGGFGRQRVRAVHVDEQDRQGETQHRLKQRVRLVDLEPHQPVRLHEQQPGRHTAHEGG